MSVVMIFKDAHAFLAEAARSVLGQSFRQLELVLVDDGGTDGSELVAAQVVALDPARVRLIRHPDRVNRGTGPSRLVGVDAARGELTAFLDADDVWSPEHLQEAVDLLAAHPAAGMVCGRVVTWRSWADPHALDTLSELAFAPGVVVPPPRLLAAVLRNGDLATTPCSLLVRTAALRECRSAAAFPDMYEDQVINSELQLRVAAVMSGATSAYYRQHPESTSARADRERVNHPAAPVPSRRRFLQWLAALPEFQASPDPELSRLLGAALRELGQRRPQRVKALAKRWVRRLPPSWRARARTGVQSIGTSLLRFQTVQPVRRVSGPSPDFIGVDRYYEQDFLRRWGEDLRGAVEQHHGHAGALGRHGPTASGRPASGPQPDLDCLVIARCGQVGDLDGVAALHGRLRPGGVLLLTLAGIAPVRSVGPSPPTLISTRRTVEPLFREVFGGERVTVTQHGNVLAASAHLHGVDASRLTAEQLAHQDADYPVLVTVRAVRSVDTA